MTLRLRAEALYSILCFFAVLGASSLYPGTPFTPIARMHFVAHQLYHLGL